MEMQIWATLLIMQKRIRWCFRTIPRPCVSPCSAAAWTQCCRPSLARGLRARTGRSGLWCAPDAPSARVRRRGEGEGSGWRCVAHFALREWLRVVGGGEDGEGAACCCVCGVAWKAVAKRAIALRAVWGRREGGVGGQWQHGALAADLLLLRLPFAAGLSGRPAAAATNVARRAEDLIWVARVLLQQGYSGRYESVD